MHTEEAAESGRGPRRGGQAGDRRKSERSTLFMTSTRSPFFAPLAFVLRAIRLSANTKPKTLSVPFSDLELKRAARDPAQKKN